MDFFIDRNHICDTTLYSQTDPVQFEVETTGVTDWLPLGVPPPECGGVGLTVGADHPRPPVTGPGGDYLDALVYISSGNEDLGGISGGLG